MRVRRLLDKTGWADADYHAALEDQANALAELTRTNCRALQAPPLEDSFRHTLTQESLALRDERERFTTWRESFV